MTKALWVVLALVSLAMGGCAWLAAHGEETGQQVKTWSALLPPPFNFIGTAVGSLLGVAGAVAANRSRVKNIAEQASTGVPPQVALGATGFLGKIIQERSTLYPLIGVVLSALKSSGAMPISDSDFLSIMTVLGTSAAAEFTAAHGADKAIAALPVVTSVAAPPKA